jgi:hypothetical protein
VARHAVATNAATPLTWIGLLAFAFTATVGLASSHARDGVLAIDPPFLFYGGVVGAILALRSGLSAQREGGLDTFLRLNFMSPLAHTGGIVLGLLGSWALFCAFAFVLALLLSGGEVATAAWYAWSLGLRIGMLLPFVIVVEATSSLRIPLFVPTAAWFALLIGLSLAVGEDRAVALMSPPVELGDFRSTLPILARSASVMAVGFGVLMAASGLRSRRSSG